MNNNSHLHLLTPIIDHIANIPSSINYLYRSTVLWWKAISFTKKYQNSSKNYDMPKKHKNHTFVLLKKNIQHLIFSSFTFLCDFFRLIIISIHFYDTYNIYVNMLLNLKIQYEVSDISLWTKKTKETTIDGIRIKSKILYLFSVYI